MTEPLPKDRYDALKGFALKGRPSIAMKTWELMVTAPGFDPFATAEPGMYIDYTKANKMLRAIELFCTHTKGELAGKPLLLSDWQKGAVLNLFGWMRADGTRRFREFWLYVPRKNGKTLFSAALVNIILFFDKEPGAEIYCAAAERDQASLLWNMSKQMIENEPNFMKRCKIFKSYRCIELPDGSICKPISADANTKHGFNAHLTCLDEVHAQKDAELRDVLVTSGGSRRQPLTIYTTTADHQRESLCNSMHEYAKRVRDGQLEDSSFLPYIYEADIKDDWTSERTWIKANPGYGISVKPEFLKQEVQKAKESPSYEQTFKRLYLNIRTESETRWLAPDKWISCHSDGRRRDECLGQRCYAGLDMSSSSDLTSFVLFFPELKSCIQHSWVPKESAIKRDRKNRVGYQNYADKGFLKLTDGDVIDQDFIRSEINAISSKYDILEIAVDRWNSQQIQTQLTDDGFLVIPFGQGFASMSSPCKTLETMVLASELEHYEDPIMRWCAGNIVVDEDAAGNKKPAKNKRTEKIDPMVALIMAIGRADVSSGGSDSKYETDGIMLL